MPGGLDRLLCPVMGCFVPDWAWARREVCDTPENVYLPEVLTGVGHPD